MAADEKRAFERLIYHCRKAQEAATELGVTRSQGSWAQVATAFQSMTENVINLANNAAGMRRPN